MRASVAGVYRFPSDVVSVTLVVPVRPWQCSDAKEEKDEEDNDNGKSDDLVAAAVAAVVKHHMTSVGGGVVERAEIVLVQTTMKTPLSFCLGIHNAGTMVLFVVDVDGSIIGGGARPGNV